MGRVDASKLEIGSKVAYVTDSYIILGYVCHKGFGGDLDIKSKNADGEETVYACTIADNLYDWEDVKNIKGAKLRRLKDGERCCIVRNCVKKYGTIKGVNKDYASYDVILDTEGKWCFLFEDVQEVSLMEDACRNKPKYKVNDWVTNIVDGRLMLGQIVSVGNGSYEVSFHNTSLANQLWSFDSPHLRCANGVNAVNHDKGVAKPTSVEDIYAELLDTYKRKNHDYGNSFGELYAEVGMPYAYGHVKEKIMRVKQLMGSEAMVNESMEDSLLDCANYCIMWVSEIRKRHDGK